MQAAKSPMDQRSLLDVGLLDNGPKAGFPLPASANIASALLFPGEDGGHSLAAWARRDLEATLQLLADRAQYITGGSGAAIALRDGENIICRASSGPSAPEVGSYFQASSGLSGESVRTRKILCCNDTASDPRVNQEGCRALGIASFAVLPLVRDNEVIGIFEIFANKANAFGERDILALQRMGEMVNTALDQVSYADPKTAPPDFPASDSLRATAAVTASAVSPAPDSAQVAPPLAPEAAVEVSDRFEVGENPEQTTDAGETPENDAPPRPLLSGTLSIHTCTACGFPVSAGRTLCLDCEAAAGKNPAFQRITPGAAAPAFLGGLGEPPQRAGIARWISANRYLLGMIGVTLSTIIFLLTR